jgi:hypothetical protein
MLASFQLKSPRIALHPTCNNCGEYTKSNKCKRFYLPEVVPACWFTGDWCRGLAGGHWILLKGEKVPPANDQFACGKMARPLLLNHVKEEAEGVPTTVAPLLQQVGLRDPFPPGLLWKLLSSLWSPLDYAFGKSRVNK